MGTICPTNGATVSMSICSALCSRAARAPIGKFGRDWEKTKASATKVSPATLTLGKAAAKGERHGKWSRYASGRSERLARISLKIPFIRHGQRQASTSAW